MGFFTGKRVLITGHTGFKGTWLSLMLEHAGAQVYGLALPAETGSLFPQVQPRLEGQYFTDICDAEAVRHAVEDCTPEILVHLAAHSSLEGALTNPGRVFASNAMGLVHVLDAVKSVGSVRAAVIVTSDKCYRNQESDTPYREDDPLGAQDPYSTSKACQELIAQCYRQSFFEKPDGLRLATARASNTVGGGDFKQSRLIPYLTDCFLHGVCAEIRSPYAVRPWQYVLDVLRGYLMLAQRLYQGDAPADAFNFGPEQDGFQTVESLLCQYAAFFPGAAYQIGGGGRQGKETKILKLDNARAKSLLGWKPLYTFSDTLAATAEFARRWDQKEPLKGVCTDMIEKFYQKAGEQV